AKREHRKHSRDQAGASRRTRSASPLTAAASATVPEIEQENPAPEEVARRQSHTQPASELPARCVSVVESVSSQNFAQTALNPHANFPSNIHSDFQPNFSENLSPNLAQNFNLQIPPTSAGPSIASDSSVRVRVNTSAAEAGVNSFARW